MPKRMYWLSLHPRCGSIIRCGVRYASTTQSSLHGGNEASITKSKTVKVHRLVAPEQPADPSAFAGKKKSPLLRFATAKVKTSIPAKALPGDGLTPQQRAMREEMTRPIDPQILLKANLQRFTKNRDDFPKPIWLKPLDDVAIETVGMDGLTQTQQQVVATSKKIFAMPVDFTVNTVALEASKDDKKPLRKTLDEMLDEKLPSKAPYKMPLWDADKPRPASPYPGIPKVAVAGRSNVGKSSLLNALIGTRLKIFQTSKTPGRTQHAEYACVGRQLTLVDLPGYGYARASKRNQKEMSVRLTKFFQKDPPRRVFLLIDARHGVMEPDKQFMDRLDAVGVAFQVVITKADKVTTKGLKAVVSDTRKILSRKGLAFPAILTTSALKRSGINALQAEIAIACGLAQSASEDASPSAPVIDCT